MSAVLSALGLPSVLRLREVCMVWPLSQQYSTVTCYLMLTTLVTGDRNRDFLLFWSCINLRQSLRPWVSGMWPSQCPCPLPNCGSQPIMPPNGSFDSISYPQVQWVFTSTLKATVIFLPFPCFHSVEEKGKVWKKGTGVISCFIYSSCSSPQSLHHQKMLFQEFHLSFGGTPGRVHREKRLQVDINYLYVQPAESPHSASINFFILAKFLPVPCSDCPRWASAHISLCRHLFLLRPQASWRPCNLSSLMYSKKIISLQLSGLLWGGGGGVGHVLRVEEMLFLHNFVFINAWTYLLKDKTMKPNLKRIEKST